MSEDYDFVIIGAGVIGLAVGNAILDLEPNSRVCILEKEPQIGLHASTRNSGVLHAGFYYQSESLKARFCVEGNKLMKEFVASNKLKISNLGKVVIAKNDFEYERLISLFHRGIKNGSTLEILPPSKLSDIEPIATSKFPFLWSPGTAIVDPKEIMQTLQERFLHRKGVVFFNSKVELGLEKSCVSIIGDRFRARYIINLAGNHSLSIAKSVSVGEEFDLLPVLGAYKETLSENLPVRTLVYPVPHPINPFLGVHVTPTLRGTVKIGPTAFPVLGPEQYTFLSKIGIGELLKSTKSFMNFAQNQRSITREIMKTEIPYLKLNNTLRDLSQMIPNAKGSTGWKPLKPGIRAQLIEKSTGKFVNDFIVREASNSMHVLNIVSPGFTSSLSFGKHIATCALTAREKGNY